MTRAWLRHPARTIRQPPCPTGQPRYASQHHADMARLHGMTPGPPPQPCTACNGWHQPASKETAA